MYREIFVIALFALSLLAVANCADECLDVSVAAAAVHKAVANPNLSQTAPTTEAQRNATIRALYQAISGFTSKHAIAVGVGYSNDDYYSIQTCNSPLAICLGTTRQYFISEVNVGLYGNNSFRNFDIDSNGAAGALISIGNAYSATSRPWYTLALNGTEGWTGYYSFANLPVSGRTFVSAIAGGRVEADRLSDEPCDQCLSRSPAVNLGNYLAANDLSGWENLNTTAAAFQALESLLTDYLIPFQADDVISSVGPGFSNGDFYFVTDCEAIPNPASTPECDYSNRYYGEIRNTRIFGNDHIWAFRLSDGGYVISAGRDEGSSYNPTVRPWYLLGSGWTDPYSFANADALFARTYASPFNGGVIDVDVNPAMLCPDWSDCEPCKSCPACPSPSEPEPCCGSGDTNINFVFADMLKQ